MGLKTLLIVLGVVISQSGNAVVEEFDSPSNCTNVRLDKNGGPYSKIPVYNQSLGISNDPNICYAVAASELIDAYRMRRGQQSQFLTSPLSIALNTRFQDGSSTSSERSLSYDDSDPLTFLVGGGSTFKALTISRKSRVCNQLWLEKSVALIRESSTAKPFDQFLLNLVPTPKTVPFSSRYLEDVIYSINRYCDGHDFTLSLPEATQLSQPGGDFLTEQAKLMKQLQSSELTTEERRKLALEFNERFSRERKIKKFGVTLNELLDAPLSSGVGIGFLYRAIGSNEQRNSIGAHAAVVIGRRFNRTNQTCEYLVRDSYGSDCFDKNGAARYRSQCENGAVWVEEKTLLKDTINLTWLKTPGGFERPR